MESPEPLPDVLAPPEEPQELKEGEALLEEKQEH